MRTSESIATAFNGNVCRSDGTSGNIASNGTYSTRRFGTIISVNSTAVAKVRNKRKVLRFRTPTALPSHHEIESTRNKSGVDTSFLIKHDNIDRISENAGKNNCKKSASNRDMDVDDESCAQTINQHNVPIESSDGRSMVSFNNTSWNYVDNTYLDSEFRQHHNSQETTLSTGDVESIRHSHGATISEVGGQSIELNRYDQISESSKFIIRDDASYSSPNTSVIDYPTIDLWNVKHRKNSSSSSLALYSPAMNSGVYQSTSLDSAQIMTALSLSPPLSPTISEAAMDENQGIFDTSHLIDTSISSTAVSKVRNKRKVLRFRKPTALPFYHEIKSSRNQSEINVSLLIKHDNIDNISENADNNSCKKTATTRDIYVNDESCVQAVDQPNIGRDFYVPCEGSDGRSTVSFDKNTGSWNFDDNIYLDNDLRQHHKSQQKTLSTGDVESSRHSHAANISEVIDQSIELKRFDPISESSKFAIREDPSFSSRNTSVIDSPAGDLLNVKFRKNSSSSSLPVYSPAMNSRVDHSTSLDSAQIMMALSLSPPLSTTSSEAANDENKETSSSTLPVYSPAMNSGVDHSISLDSAQIMTALVLSPPLSTTSSEAAMEENQGTFDNIRLIGTSISSPLVDVQFLQSGDPETHNKSHSVIHEINETPFTMQLGTFEKTTLFIQPAKLPSNESQLSSDNLMLTTNKVLNREKLNDFDSLYELPTLAEHTHLQNLRTGASYEQRQYQNMMKTEGKENDSHPTPYWQIKFYHLLEAFKNFKQESSKKLKAVQKEKFDLKRILQERRSRAKAYLNYRKQKGGKFLQVFHFTNPSQSDQESTHSIISFETKNETFAFSEYQFHNKETEISFLPSSVFQCNPFKLFRDDISILFDSCRNEKHIAKLGLFLLDSKVTRLCNITPIPPEIQDFPMDDEAEELDTTKKLLFLPKIRHTTTSPSSVKLNFQIELFDSAEKHNQKRSNMLLQKISELENEVFCKDKSLVQLSEKHKVCLDEKEQLSLRLCSAQSTADKAKAKLIADLLSTTLKLKATRRKENERANQFELREERLLDDIQAKQFLLKEKGKYSNSLLADSFEKVNGANLEPVSRLHKIQSRIEQKERKLSTIGLLDDTTSELGSRTQLIQSTEDDMQCLQASFEGINRRLSGTESMLFSERLSAAAEFETSQREIAELKLQTSNSSEIVLSLKQKSSESEALLSNTREELLAERRKFGELKVSFETLQMSFEKRLSFISKESDNLRDALTESKIENNKLKSVINVKQNEICDLTIKCDALRLFIAASKEERQIAERELCQRLEDQKENIKELSTTVKNLIAEKSMIFIELENSRKQLDDNLIYFRKSLNQSVKKHREQKENERLYSDQCRENLQMSLHQVSQLQKSLEETRQEIDSFRLRAGESEMIVNQIRIEKLKLVTEKQDVEMSLHLTNERNIKLADNIKILEESTAAFKEERHVILENLHEAEAKLLVAGAEYKKFVDDRQEAKNSEQEKLASELSVKCEELEDALAKALQSTSILEEESRKRSVLVSSLQHDLELMSTKIKELSTSKQVLEAQVCEVTASKEYLTATSAQTSEIYHRLQLDLNELRHNLVAENEQVLSLTENLCSTKLTLEKQSQSYLLKERNFVRELELYRQQIFSAENEKDIALQNLRIAKSDKIRLTEEIYEAQVRIAELEAQFSRQDPSRETLNVQRENINAAGFVRNDPFDDQMMSGDVDLQKKDIGQRKTNLFQMQYELTSTSGSINKYCNEPVLIEKTIWDLRAALNESMKIISGYKNWVSFFDENANETKGTEQFESPTVGKKNPKMTEEAKNNVSSMEGDISWCSPDAATESDTEKVLQSQRTIEYLKKAIETFYAQLENILVLNQKQTQLVKESHKREVIQNSSIGLKTEIENKNDMFDQVNKTYPTLAATNCKLNSGRLSNKKSSHSTEQYALVRDQSLDDIEMLKFELHKKSVKLASLSEVNRSQQQVLILSQTLEETLLRFIQDILSMSEKAFHEIRENSLLNNEIIQARCVGSNIDDRLWSQSRLEKISKIVPQFLSQLSVKKSQVEAWKNQRSIRVKIKDTPFLQSRNVVVADCAAIHDTIRKVRKILYKDILSPHKTGYPDNCGQVQSLLDQVQSLEQQVGQLVDGLKVANDCIKAKDDALSNVETVVAHLKANQYCQVEEIRKLKIDETDVKSTESSRINERTNLIQKKLSQAACKSIINVIERRNSMLKASALRHWYCHASAFRTVCQQDNIANALSHELGETKEKLAILKRYFKRMRRSGLSSRAISGMECISEEREIL